jgi:hypothetical protein
MPNHHNDTVIVANVKLKLSHFLFLAYSITHAPQNHQNKNYIVSPFVAVFPHQIIKWGHIEPMMITIIYSRWF